ncbi:mitotic spindle assembly checkpoint protein MAD2B-like [Maniola hyperantus]|uniref:mitotic spindle assembly checkpoint protein MAD2B-like n=1 Tax=Aphantopus hyperantus TaxID=2795564 RepID=UPI001569824A|nr:mitotic spindle assembly checkpoint protein MAD2B-like [Maniola hyperantus]
MDACCVDVTVEFLAVAFHNIMYYASIYPKNIFETRKKYGIVVYRCVHPDVNKYVDKCLKSIGSALKTHDLHRVEFAVTDADFRPGLKYVFDFDRMDDYDDAADAYLVRCEQNLRAFCLLLATQSRKFKGLPADCSFAIYLHTNESIAEGLASTPDLEDFPLVEAENEVQEMDSILPVRRFTIRNYSIDTYIELLKPWTFCS